MSQSSRQVFGRPLRAEDWLLKNLKSTSTYDDDGGDGAKCTMAQEAQSTINKQDDCGAKEKMQDTGNEEAQN